MMTFKPFNDDEDEGKKGEEERKGVSEVHQVDTVSLLLWNISMNWTTTTSMASAKKRASHIAKVIAPYDIVILTESFMHRRTLLQHIRDNQSHPYIHTDPRVWYKLFDSGVVIMSKIPLLDARYVHYSKSALWDWFTSKGLLSCMFKIGDVIVDLYGTQLQGGSQICAHSARTKQVNELVSQVQLTHNPSHELIVCGDFNCGPVYDMHQRYSVHYANETDAVLRNDEYHTFVNELKVIPLLESPAEDDTCSMLVKRNSMHIQYRRLSIEQPDESLSPREALAMEIVLFKTHPHTPRPHECSPM